MMNYMRATIIYDIASKKWVNKAVVKIDSGFHWYIITDFIRYSRVARYFASNIIYIVFIRTTYYLYIH